MTWVQPEPALALPAQALAYAREHEVHNLAAYLEMMLAWLRLRRGEWEAAERAARSALERGDRRSRAAREDGARRARRAPGG